MVVLQGEDVPISISASTYISFAVLCIVWILVFIPDTSVSDRETWETKRRSSVSENTPLISSDGTPSKKKYATEGEVRVWYFLWWTNLIDCRKQKKKRFDK